MKIGVRGLGLWGPGLAGWKQGQAVLRGNVPLADAELPPPAPACLPPNERRRCGPVTRLALAAAAEACVHADMDPAELASVFATSNGDGPVVNAILSAIVAGAGEVSPTQFHNSVHNAAAGYWTIGHGSIAPATALGCYDWSFAQGLMRAAAEAVIEKRPVLFVAYDQPIPGPIGTVRITRSAFACALVLDPDGAGHMQLDLQYGAGRMDDDTLEIDRLNDMAHFNPAARSLPLLAAIARGDATQVRLTCRPGHLTVRLS
ncbi:beta-ketoacyl synthase chain length factor [Tanticharoenia sakaeratensis]|uniref:Beta-ketoacyl synthase-like N-terminal domain-containing protein n=1 Tax=Tanticharoenia sakaeratensis NBRC 103193 TaxID=1231623 RepID=A0A0D6MKR7_9PROT|nr:beta-ketoacyl synthase chain length factor [Tanticharoenia sakaeratensis]GAN54055.1 hypothetical protein Tasa_015_044 [Tanticharoenia sakaeratensis NBRC 103193]GBQ23711.1 beta-ketoacyl synthase domain protein [Tanticharoenia sakaeratensis NBRC 103193]